MNSKISKTKYYSWKLNELPQGCRQCIKGEKLVMFVTGVCPRQCSYCPLSEQKKDKDVTFANERKIDEEKIRAIIEEARACNSKGAGFTGGDPLARIDRTCKYIKLLKKTFGKKFHIHLYTSLNLLNEKNLEMLDDAELDELRLHPELYDMRLWDKINLFNGDKYSFRLGIEIPVIPKSFKMTRKVIDYFAPYLDFINLNELEISDAESYKIKNVRTRNSQYYGAAGSQENAMKILDYISKKYPKMNVHFCTCKLKDKVQLRERLKRRAKNTAREFDIITEDGTLIRGTIYLQKPGSKKTEAQSYILKNIREELIKKYAIPKKYIEVDESKNRIITNIGIIKNIAKDLKSQGLIPAIVEQYPTYDQMEVEVEFL